MRLCRATALCMLMLLACTASVLQPARMHLAAGRLSVSAWPYLPGSIVPVRVSGFSPPYHAALVGPGRFFPNGMYAVPQTAAPSSALLIAANAQGLASRVLTIGRPPAASQPLLAVVCYDDGIVFHDPQTFGVLGLLATGGTPGGAAVDRQGRIAAADTQGDTVTIASLEPWSVHQVRGVPLGDDVAIDQRTHAIFVTDREIGGEGALSRISPGGRVTRVVTGDTAEGLAIDERRQIVYVANVNDGTVAAVDAASMRVLRRFAVVARVFSLALSPDGRRLFAISNQSTGSPFGAPGSAVAVDLRAKVPRVVARSPHLTFPVGAVLDPQMRRLFVTDESLDMIDVLDARTLRPVHAPLKTCKTPWKPSLDLRSERLYVPCAQADEVDVFDARTLRRMPGAPFKTGGYPLAVLVWNPG
jgi:DNA-binding beta-propeller fold protein YncE